MRRLFPRQYSSTADKGDSDEMDSKITYHQQVSYCGKPRCRRCREGTGHGPYWYAYQTVNGRTVRTYVGKQLPTELQATPIGLADETAQTPPSYSPASA